MTKEEIKQYAEKKVLEALTSVVERAYMDGFNDGYNDATISNKKMITPNIDGIEFIDLGLPSGTLWATDYLRDEKGKVLELVYDEASKFDIPTSEDLEEIKTYCDINFLGWKGINGNELLPESLERTLFEENFRHCTTYFWIKSNEDNPKWRYLGALNNKKISVRSSFRGDPQPVLLVKHVKK